VPSNPQAEGRSLTSKILINEAKSGLPDGGKALKGEQRAKAKENMFDNLSDKLGGIFDKLRGKGNLSEEDVNAAAREIRVALLEADVALPVVKDFIETVKENAIGAEVAKKVTASQQMVKIVHDAMVDMLGGDVAEELIRLKSPISSRPNITKKS